MMDGHEYFEELIFREDSLSETERSELKAHLALCAECVCFRDDWIAVNTLFTNAPAVSPAPGFVVLFENGRAVPAQRRNAAPWKGLAIFVIGLLLLIAANLALIANHVWLTLIVRATEKLMMARLIWDSIAAFLYMIRLPLLIGGTAAIIAAFIVGFGILLSLRQYQQSHEKRGV